MPIRFNKIPSWGLVILLSAILAGGTNVLAQKSADSTGIYKVNPYVSGLLGIGGVALGQYLINDLANDPPIPVNEILRLDKSNVNSFDRIAVEQENWIYASEAAEISDYWLMGSVLLPATLYFDKRVRNEWLNVALMYFETQALAANLYVWAGPRLAERYRPVTYYNRGEFDIDELTPGRNRHSWFSGHVTNTTAGTYFFAKVLTDMHPEWKGKWKIWAAASVPPVVVGYLRYRALKHFPTDVIMGFIAGGGSAILVPYLHKKKDNRLKMSFYYDGDNYGLSARLTLK